MKSIDKLRKRKGVSPVIATVILVAVAITVSVAVAYWMGGIAGQYTQFEKVEIQSGVCAKLTTTDVYWNITIKLKNSGTASATVTSIFVNDIEVSEYGVVTGYDPVTAHGNQAVTDMLNELTIESGATQVINILIDSNQYLSLSSGTTVNIKIHSAGGMDYIKLVELV